MHALELSSLQFLNMEAVKAFAAELFNGHSKNEHVKR